ncbi:seryl-tRNA synthetase family protein [Streptococcus pneumoniae]|nr:seryl-tRNA synthetase family protein [Streptococcus pneumoniae]
MAEFTFEIEEHLLTLSENEKGWTKEINRVSFNGAPAKFDIRAWSPDHTKMGKGITLSNEEFQTMVDAFKGNYVLHSLLFPFCRGNSDSRKIIRKSLQNSSKISANHVIRLAVLEVTDFVSFIYNLKTVF